jgi:arylsulfatase A-like enzyme
MNRYRRRDFLCASASAAAALSLPGVSRLQAQRRNKGPELNVLFIAADDLRPDLGCYGNTLVRTPNIDRLAQRGLTFTRAYCQQAVGSPSRTSLLTGLRPDSTRVYDLETHFRRHVPNAVTLPQLFKKHGYATTAFGKIFHKPQMNDQPSWSIAPWIADSFDWNSDENRQFNETKWNELREANWTSAEEFYFDPEKRNKRPAGQSAWGMPSWRELAVRDDELPDGKTAAAAIRALDQLKTKRFFLGVGFLRPHLPFVAPEKYFDLYPRDRIHAAENPNPPQDTPAFALHNSEELRGYSDIPQSGPIPEQKARELIRAYYASISFVDAQAGRLLDALDERGLTENTVVVLWGDHGYHLGDHGLWSKHSNFESATHAPLIVSYPGQRSKGRKTQALTELVDIYPSLADICGLPRPANLEGSSFVPVFEDPDRLWKRAAFSQYPREIPGVGPGMGYSLRTRRYRYTEWFSNDTNFRSAELYDHETDPGENFNIAYRPENVSLVNGLSGMLRDGWRSSLPPTEGPV